MKIFNFSDVTFAADKIVLIGRVSQTTPDKWGFSIVTVVTELHFDFTTKVAARRGKEAAEASLFFALREDGNETGLKEVIAYVKSIYPDAIARGPNYSVDVPSIWSIYPDESIFVPIGYGGTEETAWRAAAASIRLYPPEADERTNRQ